MLRVIQLVALCGLITIAGMPGRALANCGHCAGDSAAAKGSAGSASAAHKCDEACKKDPSKCAQKGCEHAAAATCPKSGKACGKCDKASRDQCKAGSGSCPMSGAKSEAPAAAPAGETAAAPAGETPAAPAGEAPASEASAGSGAGATSGEALQRHDELAKKISELLEARRNKAK